MTRCSGSRATFDDGDRCVRSTTVRNQVLHELGKSADAHIDGQCLPIARERRPIEIVDRVLAMCRHQHDRLRVVAVCQRVYLQRPHSRRQR